MIRGLILLGVSLIGLSMVLGSYVAYLLLAPSAPQVASSAPPGNDREPTVYDVDAMAARLPMDREYYAKVRDQAVAAYEAGRNKSQSLDPEAKASLCLGAYLVTWGDYYGEGLHGDLATFAHHSMGHGDSMPMLSNLQAIGWDDNHYPDSDLHAVERSNKMMAQTKTDVPVAFQAWGLHTAVMATLRFNRNAYTLKTNPPSMQLLPTVILLWGDCLEKLIKDQAPTHVLYEMPEEMLETCSGDADLMNLVISAIDRAYDEAGSDNGLRVALDGQYAINMAWLARGTGYADTVTDAMNRSFEQRLVEARNILEPACDKYPSEPRLPVLMLTVALGQGFDHDAMDTWFQRAIKIDPNNVNAYRSKAYFLQPRWYGSVNEEWDFVQKCIATQNWDYKIPMSMPAALNMVADNGAPDLFTQDAVWKVVEPTYREILKRYPRSVVYRTYFLRAALLGHHPEIVREQYKILGARWDQSLLTSAEENEILSLAQ